jgi:hypothetical protein
VLAAITGLCIIAFCALYLQAVGRLTALQQEAAAALRAERFAQRPVFAISAEQASAVNEAIRRLNTPWERVFLALNAASAEAKQGSVGLLALEPDLSGQVVKVTAEARTVEAMLSYQRALQRQSAVQSALLVRHETITEDPSAPIRFLIETRFVAQLESAR